MTGSDRQSKAAAARIDDTTHNVFAIAGLSLLAILISLSISDALLGLISP